MERTPIVIDCDPGVDDSYAIALAHFLPEFELRAITAVEGNVPAAVTRRNALCLAELFSIPCRVGFGAELPLKKPYFHDASHVHGKGGVGDIVFPDPSRAPDPKPAWEVIWEEAVRAKGELVLIAVGPLTNIAMALLLHPELPRCLKRFCIMGGGTFGNRPESGNTAEFNIWVDPTAARIVFERLEVWMVGLDATHRSAIMAEDFDALMVLCGPAPESDFLRRLSAFSQWNNRQHGWDNNIIHDAVAVAAMTRRSPVTFRDARVWVEDGEDAPNNGQTLVDFSSPAPNCHVAMEVDQPAFLALLKEMCRGYNR